MQNTTTQDSNNNEGYEIINCRETPSYLSQRKDFEEFTNLISQCINGNEKQVYSIVSAIVQTCLLEKTSIEDITTLTSQCIKENEGQAAYIMLATINACLLEKKSIEDITTLTSQCIEKNEGQVFSIVDATVQACLLQGQPILDIATLISQCIKKNKGQAYSIVSTTVQACLSQKKPIEEIPPLILQCIKENEEQAFPIVNAAIQICLSKENSIEEIENILESSFKLPVIEENIGKFKEMIFINSLNYLLANNKFTEEREKEFCDYYNKNLKTENQVYYSDFNQIPLARLKEINDSYLKYRFEKNTIDGSRIEDIYLKMFLESIKEEEFGNKNLKSLIEENDLSKKLIYKDFQTENIKDNEELFKIIGLKEEDFGKGDKKDDYTVVCAEDGAHAFLLIIDKTKTYEDSKNRDSNCVKIFDSSVNYKNGNFVTVALAKQANLEFYNKLKFLNTFNYQENGTCGFQASAAASTIIRECKKFEDIEKGFEVQPKYIISPLLTKILNNVYFKYNSLADNTIELLSNAANILKQQYKILTGNKQMLKNHIIDNLNKDLNKITDQKNRTYGFQSATTTSTIKKFKDIKKQPSCLILLLSEGFLNNVYFKNSLADEEHIKLLSDEAEDINKKNNQPVIHANKQNSDKSQTEALKNKQSGGWEI